MWTRLTAATAALLAAVASSWWIVQPDDTRSLGQVTVLVVGQPPSGSEEEIVVDVDGTAIALPAINPCTGLSPALFPTGEVEWSSVTQGNGVRACRWIRTWRTSDLLAQQTPGELRARLANGVLTVTLDPLLPEHGKGVTTLDVTVSFPGEVLTQSGAGVRSGSTVEWTNPEGFFSGVGLAATGRDRPLLVAVVPWVILALALVGFVASVPWSRAGRGRAQVDATAAVDRVDPTAATPPSPGGRPADSGDPPPQQVQATAVARPAGHDPDSPWRPPSPH